MYHTDIALFHTPRGHRSSVIAVITLFLFTSIWIYSGRTTIPDSLRRSHALGWFTTTNQKNLAPEAGHLIPPKIWQILLTKRDGHENGLGNIDPDKLQDTGSWLAMNADYTL